MSGERDNAEELDVSHVPEFQRRFWRFQSIGGIVILAALILAVLGVFGGSGPLVSTTVGVPDGGVSVEYQRFARKRSPLTMRIHLEPGATDSSQAVVRISRSYLEAFAIENINPEPEQAEAGDRYLTYTFELSDPSTETAITINMEAEAFGVVTGEVQLDDRAPLDFSQFVFP